MFFYKGRGLRALGMRWAVAVVWGRAWAFLWPKAWKKQYPDAANHLTATGYWHEKVRRNAKKAQRGLGVLLSQHTGSSCTECPGKEICEVKFTGRILVGQAR